MKVIVKSIVCGFSTFTNEDKFVNDIEILNQENRERVARVDKKIICF